MNRWRLPTKLAILVTIPVVCTLAVAIAGYRELGRLNEDITRMVTVTAKANGLVSDLRSDIQFGRRMEFRAVLSPDDKETRMFADDARSWARRVDDSYRLLDAALADGRTPAEVRQSLERFRAAWDEYHPSMEKTLQMSAENSNVKAHELTKGRFAEKILAVDETVKGWQRQLDKQATDLLAAKDLERLTVVAMNRQALSRLHVIALDLHRQLSLQIFAANDEELELLGEQIPVWFREVDARLGDLSAKNLEQDATRWDALDAAFRGLRTLATQLQKLLRANTTARSEEMIQAEGKNLEAGLASLTQLATTLNGQLQRDMRDVQRGATSAQWLMVTAPLIGISLTVVLGSIMARGIVREMRRLSQSIANSATELTAVSHQVMAQSEETTMQASSVASGAEQTSTNITTMAAAAGQMSTNVASISSASEEISVNVATISSSAEETARQVTAVSLTIRESTRDFQAIASDAQEGAAVAGRATEMANDAGHTMKQLEQSAVEIEKVTETIKMLALQTNLLALNATIGATSAGEAGSGFAVVAREIKELARQSAEAAEDIARRIEAIQSATHNAVGAIQEVQRIIGTLNTAAQRTSTAIEKQSAMAERSAENLAGASQGVELIARSIAEVAKGATDMSCNAGDATTAAFDMSKNASEAAKAVTDISANIHGISQSTRDNVKSAHAVNAAAEHLTTIATELQQLVG